MFENRFGSFLHLSYSHCVDAESALVERFAVLVRDLSGAFHCPECTTARQRIGHFLGGKELVERDVRETYQHLAGRCTFFTAVVTGKELSPVATVHLWDWVCLVI